MQQNIFRPLASLSIDLLAFIIHYLIHPLINLLIGLCFINVRKLSNNLISSQALKATCIPNLLKFLYSAVNSLDLVILYLLKTVINYVINQNSNQFLGSIAQNLENPGNAALGRGKFISSER